MPDMDVGMTVGLIKALGSPDPAVIEGAVSDWLDDHPEATTTVEDGAISYAKLNASLQETVDDVGDLKTQISDINTATSGAIGKALSPKTVSGGKVTEWQFKSIGGGTSADLFYVTPEEYGAVGDGVTDDSQAVQDACDAGYAVYFASGKTYYLASTVTIYHDCHLFGGEGATIKTKTPTGGSAPNGIVVTGTLKKTTTITSDYTSGGNTDNSGNKFTLSDMTNIDVGDIIVIEATDQYYNYARQYYHLGATLLVSDINDGHIFVCDAMPWDISATANVSVNVYDAPTVIVNSLNFVSETNSADHYRYCLSLIYCKNAVVDGCVFSDTQNGLIVQNCVNTSVDNVVVYHTDADATYDSYGVVIFSSSNTVVQRMMTLAANSALELSGNIPSINTRILKSNLFSEVRATGIGTHESMYNTLIEDCVLGGMNCYGTAEINRCRFVRTNRINQSVVNGITIRGSHNAKWSNTRISNCEFDGDACIQVANISVQNPVQSFNQVQNTIEIENCIGGGFRFDVVADTDILSNTVNNLIIRNWSNCSSLYHKNDAKIKSLIVENSTFTGPYWLTDYNTNHRIYTDNVGYIKLTNANPQIDNLLVNTSVGGRYYLPKDIDISFSSSDASAHYVVCGNNIASNNIDDFEIGSVTGQVGGTLTRGASTAYATALTKNQSDELVFTQPDLSFSPRIYHKCLAYVQNQSLIRSSVTVKNTGNTDGSSFRIYLAIVDADTGLITYNNHGTYGQATAQGLVLTQERDVPANSLILVYLYCYTAVANSETTLSDFVAKITPYEFISNPLTYEPYVGTSRTGSGTLKSVAGQNNIMIDSTGTAVASFRANLLE